ncbi:YdcF family protein [Rhodococcus aetherivorans]|uniref:YdcF family protein n=1 Tax=Rhodococcus aetherivorans TaxID=191292 RepID=UPI000A929B16|nr:YdcF family protein [Rhodococcus aetherivorans]MDV6292736.1 YdcF family protein [Rhodococcus aetherivorans]
MMLRSNWSRVRLWVMSICIPMIAASIGGVPVYVRPQTDPLRPADAIFVLGGEDWRRHMLGVELGAAGWAPNVVLSYPDGPGANWAGEMCGTVHPGFELDCFLPDPPTTRGEARELRRRATQNGWKRVIVVTFTPHISRARFILQRCFDGELIMVASPVEMWPWKWVSEYVYQTAGYVKAELDPGC